GAGQAERVAQHPQQRHVGIDIDCRIPAVDAELDHGTSCSGAPAHERAGRVAARAELARALRARHPHYTARRERRTPFAPLPGEASCQGPADPLQCLAATSDAKASAVSQNLTRATSTPDITTEVVIIGAGPCGLFHLRTAGGVSFDAGTVVIAAGVGSFQPRRIGLEGAEAFEGSAIHYRVKSAAELVGKHLVIFGGGDSALDWTLELLPRAASLTLVHRRHEFRAAPASVARMREQVAAARLRCFEAQPHSLIVDGGALRGVDRKITRLNSSH